MKWKLSFMRDKGKKEYGFCKIPYSFYFAKKSMKEKIWYIKLHRQIQENMLFQEKRTFSKFEAWIDILLECNFKQWEFLLWYDIIEIPIWSYITSKVKMQAKYNWSRKKLDNYIRLLESQKMLLVKTVWKGTHKATQLFVLKYTQYQVEEKWKDTQGTYKEHTGDTQGTTIEERQEEQERKEYILTHWNSKNITVHKKITNDIDLQLRSRLDEYSKEDIIKSIDIYSDVYFSEKCFFSYKWTLWEFLQRKNWMRVFLYKSIDDYLIESNIPAKKEDTWKVKTLEEQREWL